MLINELMQQTNPKSILLLNMDPLYFEIWENPGVFYGIIEIAEKVTRGENKISVFRRGASSKGVGNFCEKYIRPI
jgi:hypothetical protein